MTRTLLDRRLLLPTVLLGLLLSTAAHAEPKDDARRHFRAGLAAVEAQDYDTALQHFLAAQEAYPHHATLYNIARVYGDMGDLSNALQFYRLYRDEAIEGAIDVDPVISAIEARGGAAPSVVTGPSDRPPPTEPGELEDLTEVERARLSDIQQELAALSQTFEDRGANNAALNTANASGILTAVDAAPGIPVDLGNLGVGEGTTDITELDLEALGIAMILDDPYQRSVVTASRYGQDPLDSPATVTVLTSEDIRLSGVIALPELLRRVVGVDVAQLAAGHADVSIRGFNRELNNKVLVLIDGRSTYWDFLGATLWEALPITLEEIERIEIIRGPGSAVYGANAVTGVINIITKVPGDVQETVVQIDSGTIGMSRGTVYTNGQVGEHRYRFSAGFKQHGRWSKEVDLTEKQLNADDSPLTPFTPDQETGQKSLVMSGRIDRTFGRLGFASVTAGYNQGSFEYYSLGALSNYGMDYTHQTVRGDLSWGVLHGRVFWNGERATSGPWLNPTGIRYDNHTRVAGDTYDVEIETPVDFTTGAVDHRFNAGVGYRQKRIALDYLRGGFDNPYLEHHLSAFLQEEATINKAKVVASMRIDRHPLIPDITKTISPRLAAIYRVAQATSIRATAGSAFRAPNTLEARSDFELPAPFDGAYILVPGDPELRPERIWTAELGVHDESSDYHVADAVFFVNQLVDPPFLPDPTYGVFFYDDERQGYQVATVPFSALKNSFLAYGVEVEGRIFPVDGMDLFANVDWQQVQYKGVLPSFTIPAELKVNAGWMWRTPWRTDLTLTTNYVSEMAGNISDFDENGDLYTYSVPLPAHILLSSRIGVRPTKDENLELAFTGWNITAPGDGYIEHTKGQWLRTRVHGTVIYKF